MSSPIKDLPHRTVSPYNFDIDIRSVRHRGLRRLIEQNNPRFLRQNLVDRVRKILTVLILAEHIDGLIAGSPRPAGVSTGSQVTDGMNGAFRFPQIGGSHLRKRTATLTA